MSLTQQKNDKPKWEKAGAFWVRPKDFKDIYSVEVGGTKKFLALVRGKSFFGLRKKDYIAHCELTRIREKNGVSQTFTVSKVLTVEGKETHDYFSSRKAFANSISSVLFMYIGTGSF